MKPGAPCHAFEDRIEMIDPPDAALDHRQRRVLGVQEVAVDRDRDRAAERGQVLFQEPASMQPGRVVDHDVDAAPGVEHRTDVRQHVLLDADVTGHRQPDPAVALDPAHRGLGRLELQVVTRHPRRTAPAPARSRSRCSAPPR
jgi:hypothetical protein